MGRIERFEDIVAWQTARRLTRAVYSMSCRGAFSRDFGLKDQIRRSSVSAMSNIAEGFERGGDREFHQFLSDAKGSAGEVRSQLYVALDQGYITSDEFAEVSREASDMSGQVAGLMRYLKSSAYRGDKFREGEPPYDDGLDAQTSDIDQ